MFSDNRIGIHEAADYVWKDLIIDDRWTQVFNKCLNLPQNNAQ